MNSDGEFLLFPISPVEVWVDYMVRDDAESAEKGYALYKERFDDIIEQSDVDWLPFDSGQLCRTPNANWTGWGSEV
jgi:hypothetical protein